MEISRKNYLLIFRKETTWILMWVFVDSDHAQRKETTWFLMRVFVDSDHAGCKIMRRLWDRNSFKQNVNIFDILMMIIFDVVSSGYTFSWGIQNGNWRTSIQLLWWISNYRSFNYYCPFLPNPNSMTFQEWSTLQYLFYLQERPKQPKHISYNVYLCLAFIRYFPSWSRGEFFLRSQHW